jgi:hypothetical protein
VGREDIVAKAPTPAKPASLATAKTSSAAFSTQFRENPAAALKAKGLVISDSEAKRLTAQVGQLAARPSRGGAAAAEVEVSVSVKVKF